MTNRVDELESRVAALEATVDGLTDELVEAKDRLRALDPAIDDSVDANDGSEAGTEVADGGEERRDEIIVA